MSSYTFQFFCGPDAATAMSTATSAAAKKAAAPKPAPAPVPMLPPPRPRPSSAPPMRPVMGRAPSGAQHELRVRCLYSIVSGTTGAVDAISARSDCPSGFMACSPFAAHASTECHTQGNLSFWATRLRQ